MDATAGPQAGLPRGVTTAVVYALSLHERFRGTVVREGVLLEGPHGWGDFCPFPEYGDVECVAWLHAAAEQAGAGAWPAAVRSSVPVNVIVPAVGPDRAAQIVAGSGCATAKVKVAEPGQRPGEDIARVIAVREALGPQGSIRVDANAAWDLTTALTRLPAIDLAAGGLEYAEQPCAGLADLAVLRRRLGIRIAVDESVRRGGHRSHARLSAAADVVVLKAAPLGGVLAGMAVAESVGLPCVVSSALESGVGLAAELALAAALPRLAGACGLATGALLAQDVTADAPVVRDGRLAATGLRPAPHLASRQAWQQRDPARRDWWLRRLGRVSALAGLG